VPVCVCMRACAPASKGHALRRLKDKKHEETETHSGPDAGGVSPFIHVPVQMCARVSPFSPGADVRTGEPTQSGERSQSWQIWTGVSPLRPGADGSAVCAGGEPIHSVAAPMCERPV
jgi:hypothetical protein